MPTSSIERYQIYLYIGGIYFTGLKWLREGEVEKIEEVAGMISVHFTKRRIG